MVVSLAIGFSLLLAQTPKVSFELRGVRLENAASVLAKELGLGSLTIGPTLINDVLLLRCKEVDPAIVRDKIAQTFNATWEQRDGGWRLTQSDVQKEAERKVFDAERYHEYEKVVDAAKKKAAKMPAFDEAYCQKIQKELLAISRLDPDLQESDIQKRIRKLDSQSPRDRLAARIVQRMTPDMFMKLSDERSHLVYSSQPTTMQVALPFPTKDLIDQAVREQNTWSQAAGPDPILVKMKSRGGWTIEEGEVDNEGFPIGDLNSNRKTLSPSDFAIVTMSLDLSSYQGISIQCYDQKGLRSTNASFSIEEDDGNFIQSDQGDATELPDVKLTGLAKEYMSVLFSDYSEKDSPKPSPTLMWQILHPETSDPLSISAPDVIFGSIKTPNIVVAMSEDQRFLTAADFILPQNAKSDPGIVGDDGTWLVYRYKNPIQIRRQMIDRKVLGPILRYVDKNSRAKTLEDQANFTFSLPDQEDQYYFDTYFRVFGRYDILGLSESRRGLRIFGSMTESQRKQARQSGISLGQLSSATAREIYRALFGSTDLASSQMDRPNDENLSDKQIAKIDEFQEMVSAGIYSEATFAVPNGLQKDFMVKIEDVSTETLCCSYVKPEGTRSIERFWQGVRGEINQTSPEEIGSILFMESKPGLYGLMESDMKLDRNRFRIGQDRTAEIKLFVGHNIYYSWQLQHLNLDDPTEYTLKTLPKKYRDEIQSSYDEAEKEFKENGPPNLNPTKGSSKTPPPRH